MINLYNAQIESLSVHRIGNKSRNEALFLSQNAYQFNDELNLLLKEYFFKSFREKEENYFQFTNEADIEFNPLYKIASDIFSDPSTAHEQSKRIGNLLYEQSQHPHIKSGELYVTFLENCLLDNKKVNAIGIFKSELKHDFLQFEEQYSNRYDTKYWLEHFLGVEAFADSNFHTKKYIKFCQDFAKDVILPAEDKKEEVMFMNRAVNHFAKNDKFEETSFLNDVIENPELIPEFKHYKVEKAPKYQIEDLTEFPIANTAVSDARKKIKNVINLDTNVQIKMDFINPESAEKFVEKGWDEEKQMYYYLVYFNKEQKD